MKILVLNSGSSSQKSCLYEITGALPQDPPVPLWEGKIEWNGDQAEIDVCTRRGEHQKSNVAVSSRAQAIEQLLETLWKGKLRAISSLTEINVVGHRVVHGGQSLKEPTRVTPEARAAIAKMSSFAPLHNRAELEGIELVERQLGNVLQVAVFDTGFHSQLPEPAAVYPGPYDWLAQGIRRYGFHGINHQYCAQRAAQLLSRELNSLKLVTCHLGNGCSLAAIRAGRSVDTTMGFTPSEGLMMGTRSGSIDPGILTYLLRESGQTGAQLDELLNSKSGLLGISGISSDMRQIVAAKNNSDARAKLAFDIFVHRLRSGIGAMIAVLGGIDALIFSGGIGEHSPEVRAEACVNFSFLGLKLDDAKNSQPVADSGQEISTSDSTVRVLVIRAQENWAIARDCWRLAGVYPEQAHTLQEPT